jgi:2-dehydropantoate 2-reductase
MRLLVVGAGATGGYFGGRLAAAGRDITFLVRPRRADRLKAEGLQILSPHGNLTLKPKLAIAGDITEPFDALLLSVKAFALDQAIDDIALGVGPETMIVPVLNGMKHIEVLCARFGDSAVVGCTCRIASAVDEEGRIVQLTGLHDLSYGEMNGVLSARIKRLDDFMQSAGFNATLSQSIECEMWEKWVMLATVGAVNCLMRGTVGEVEAARGGVRFALEVLGEVVATVTALGHPPSQECVANTREFVTAKNSSATSSMYRDMLRGSHVEADQIIGDLLARARSADVSTPMLETAYAHLCVYQNRLLGEQQR